MIKVNNNKIRDKVYYKHLNSKERMLLFIEIKILMYEILFLLLFFYIWIEFIFEYIRESETANPGWYLDIFKNNIILIYQDLFIQKI